MMYLKVQKLLIKADRPLQIAFFVQLKQSELKYVLKNSRKTVSPDTKGAGTCIF